ncbi:MAG TPA: GDCCVxC domain-containing (seleno)protein [Mesorhizobium sp.]|nr:GDCCVxC domain-containing (seleno)protein [Mesorhizobium sp.]
MPTAACRYVYVCPRCSARLTPKKGHCCVFCSYGSVSCPPIQEERPARSDRRQS